MNEGRPDPVDAAAPGGFPSPAKAVAAISDVASAAVRLPLAPFQAGVTTARGRWRTLARALERRSLVRASRAVPRTLRFVGRALLSGEVDEAVPRPALSIALAAQVALDEALLAVAMTPSRFPLRADYHRVSRELADARALFGRRGWLADPASYHRTPPPLRPQDVTWSRHRTLGARYEQTPYERMSFDSGFAPRRQEPGGDRWRSFAANDTAAVTILRHDDGPRPWVVGVHGFCMGFALADFRGLHADLLHRELGFNVAMPVLPLHGPRRVTRISGEPFLSFELMNGVHGMTQSIWDIRRLLGWIRAQGAPSISVYGVSLGGYIAALLAGLEDGLDSVVAGIPVSDFPGLFHAHSPHHIRARSIEHKILGGPAEDVYRVISPLGFAPRLPRHRRFVFAGYGDRLSTPGQARRRNCGRRLRCRESTSTKTSKEKPSGIRDTSETTALIVCMWAVGVS
ncbi:MAG TPA: hypothetical protein VMT69_02610, partial [Kineosporiaceae bacterium]|nr:hypothetical protein [Kineosporiaceae bacterium]